MYRICEVCKEKNNKHLYTQQFVLPGLLGESRYGYDVVACEGCGFVYATNILSRKELSDFYKSNLKYAYKSDGGDIPAYAKWLHAKSYEFVDNYLAQLRGTNAKKISILDVGCGAGYLLNCFKEHGYTDLSGLDPAKDCRITAKKLYGIEITTATLEEYQTKRKFDLVILGSVLEHMSQIDEVVEKIKLLLKFDGLLYLCVPDADHMGAVLNEPFLEFSLEHINYFTRVSMSNLLCSRGLGKVGFESLLVEQYGGYALNAMWQKDDSHQDIKYDVKGESRIVQYVSDSNKKLALIAGQIDELVKSGEEIYVWGVGSLASRLLASTNLLKVNIVAFIDSNPAQQGKIIAGKKILPPDTLKNRQATILVTSYIHGEAIRQDLVHRHHHEGKIITLA